MNSAPCNLFVWTEGNTAIVRITGRANFTTSVDFKKLMNHLADNGYKTVLLDLSDCALMDSTFLGVLANEGNKRATTTDTGVAPGLQLVNPNSRVQGLIDNLGVAHFFQMVSCDFSNQTFEPINPNADTTREEITRTCLEAHETLMALNPANVAKFKDVVHYFAETLKGQQGT